MLRYLRRVDDLTTGKLRWGMLTNGARWRLYYQGARSVSEQFFELDLAFVLAIPGHEGGLFALSEAAPALVRVFALCSAARPFSPRRRAAHFPSASRSTRGDSTKSGSPKTSPDLVFGSSSRACQAIAAAAPAFVAGGADSALILLYRLLFILYAEDRGLLPVRDAGTPSTAYGTRSRGNRPPQGSGRHLFDTATRYWIDRR